MAFMQGNPLASAIQSMMSSGSMGDAGMSGGGFPFGRGGMTRMPDLSPGGPALSPSGGGMSSILSSIRSMVGNPLQRGGMGGGQTGFQSGSGGMGQSGFQGGMGGVLNGMDPNMLMMHLMNGGSLGSLMQMLQGQQGQQGQPGGMAPQMNPAAGMMGGFNRTMAR